MRKERKEEGKEDGKEVGDRKRERERERERKISAFDCDSLRLQIEQRLRRWSFVRKWFRTSFIQAHGAHYKRRTNKSIKWFTSQLFSLFRVLYNKNSAKETDLGMWVDCILPRNCHTHVTKFILLDCRPTTTTRVFRHWYADGTKEDVKHARIWAQIRYLS